MWLPFLFLQSTAGAKLGAAGGAALNAAMDSIKPAGGSAPSSRFLSGSDNFD
jgi:hypothetical protein